jgi:hypothetical protein
MTIKNRAISADPSTGTTRFQVVGQASYLEILGVHKDDMVITIFCVCHEKEVQVEHYEGNLFREPESGIWHTRKQLPDEAKLGRAPKASSEKPEDLEDVYNESDKDEKR